MEKKRRISALVSDSLRHVILVPVMIFSCLLPAIAQDDITDTSKTIQVKDFPGDAKDNDLSDLLVALQSNVTKTIPKDHFEYGLIGSNGLNASTNTPDNVRSMFYYKVTKGTVVKCRTMAVFEYDSLHNFISRTPYCNQHTVENDGYIRIMEFVRDASIREVEITSPFMIDNTYISAPPQKKDNSRLFSNKYIFDIAHRGARRFIPEETTPAYVNAKAKGSNGFEGDLRLTKDGVFVVNHDDQMPSNFNYRISEHTLAELRENANMGYFNGKPLPILTFKELLFLGKTLDMFVAVEFKVALTREHIETLTTTARSLGMQDRVIYIAKIEDARTFREFYPKCYLAIYNTRDPKLVKPLVSEQCPGRTLLTVRSPLVTEKLVEDFAKIDVGVLGWTIVWLFPDGWTEESFKNEVKRTVECGVAGMSIDYWTLAEIYEEEYQEYILREPQ